MKITSYESALNKLGLAFEEANEKMFLAYGTLLGAVREGHVLEHDRDIDVYMLAKPKMAYPKLLRAIRRHEGTPVYNMLVNIEEHPGGMFFEERNFTADKGIARIINVRFKPDISVDIFLCFPNQKKGLYYGLQHKFWRAKIEFILARAYPLEVFDNPSTVKIGNRKYLGPQNPEKYLEWVYGNWKTPTTRTCHLLPWHEITEDDLFDGEHYGD